MWYVAPSVASSGGPANGSCPELEFCIYRRQHYHVWV